MPVPGMGMIVFLVGGIPFVLVPPAPVGTAIVAAVAIPLPSVVTVTGSGWFNRPTQLSPLAPYVATKRCARKVNSELATAGSGEACAIVSALSSCRRAGATLS